MQDIPIYVQMLLYPLSAWIGLIAIKSAITVGFYFLTLWRADRAARAKFFKLPCFKSKDYKMKAHPFLKGFVLGIASAIAVLLCSTATIYFVIAIYKSTGG